MKECVIIDGVRSANVRAHKDKGWFRALMPDEILTSVYDGLFARNPKVTPDDIDAVFCGCSHISDVQFDIGRFAWLAGGFPEKTPTNTITNMCPSGMSAILHAARAIMCGEAETIIASGAEDMLKVPQGTHCVAPKRYLERYGVAGTAMGMTAEKIARVYNVNRLDQENMTYWSHKKAYAAQEAGKYRKEIIPIKGLDENGSEFMVDRDQWIRQNISMEEMAKMKPAFLENGIVTAATSSPLTAGACALLLMSRERADKLGLEYHVRYAGGAMAGCDPTIMGIGPVPAVKKLLDMKGLSKKDIELWELNEAFAGQALAVIREIGIGQNAPFDNINVWGGALAMGHPQGESGARIVVTLGNIMKNDFPKAKYGIATLCGGIGNAAAVLLQNVN